VQAWHLRNQRPGLWIYGVSGRAAAPFSGGTLCVGAPRFTTPGASSNGRFRPANDCSGFHELDWNAFACGNLGGSPLPALRVPGTVVDCQFWGRDPGYAAPDNAALSNALEYVIGL
jgi:hypothetical protein